MRAHLQVRRGALGEHGGVEVGREDRAVRPHPLRQPAGDRPAAAPDLEARPAARDPPGREDPGRPLVQHRLEGLQPAALRRAGVAERVGLVVHRHLASRVAPTLPGRASRRRTIRLPGAPAAVTVDPLDNWQYRCPSGNTRSTAHAAHHPSPLRQAPRRRRGRPRPVDGVAPREGRRGGPRRRQDGRRRGRVRHRLRRRAQQLLPAGDVRADGRVRRDLGVRPRDAALPRLGLRRARPAVAGARPRRGLRAPAAHRLPVGAAHRRGATCARTCARSTPTGARPASPSASTSTPAASPSTRRRCSASRTRRGRPARRSSRASRSPASTATTPAR